MDIKDILIAITLFGFLITIITTTWKVFSKFSEIKDLVQKVKDSISPAIKDNNTTEHKNRKPIDKNLEDKIIVLEKAVDNCIDHVSVLNGNIFDKNGIYQELNTLKVIVEEMRKQDD